MVGNRLHTLFWEDCWLGNVRLKEKFKRLYSISMLQNMVISNCGFWDGMVWNWSLTWARDFFV